jgi:hypothetical protein
MGKHLPIGIFHHKIALFCTVSAKMDLARGLARNFSNEINDLEANLKPSNRQKSF